MKVAISVGLQIGLGIVAGDVIQLMDVGQSKLFYLLIIPKNFDT